MNQLKKPPIRPPTAHEVLSGVPEWFTVFDTVPCVEYISSTGKKFHSIEAVKKWRANGPFEDPDWSIPSF
jgi:hypothetical protein|tara:strand:+ start:134 stop:343 length:210 start_codon:yes stop_codon:yes gene_type:complete